MVIILMFLGLSQAQKVKGVKKEFKSLCRSSGEDELAKQQVNFFSALYGHRTPLQTNLNLGGLSVILLSFRKILQILTASRWFEMWLSFLLLMALFPKHFCIIEASASPCGFALASLCLFRLFISPLLLCERSIKWMQNSETLTSFFCCKQTKPEALLQVLMFYLVIAKTGTFSKNQTLFRSAKLLCIVCETL